MEDLTPPTRSPWERPLPGQDQIEFDLAPVPAPPGPDAKSSRQKRLAVLGACVALLVAGGVAFVALGNDDPEDSASGLREVEAVSDVTEPDRADTETTISDANSPSGTTAPSPTTVSETTLPSAVAPDTTAPAPSTIGPTEVPAGTYSFELASQSPPALAQRFRMTTIADGEKSVVEGAIDEMQRTQMTMRGADGTLAMDIVMDVEGGVGYYSGPAFDDMLTGGATWVGINLEDAMAESGQSLDGLRDNLSGAASAARGMVDFEPMPLGLTEIDGESVMLYQVTLTGEQLSGAIAGNPQFVPGGMPAEAAELIDGVVYGFYITEANVVRRMEMSMELAGSEIQSTYDFLPIEPGYQVTLPDPATVQLIDVNNIP